LHQKNTKDNFGVSLATETICSLAKNLRSSNALFSSEMILAGFWLPFGIRIDRFNLGRMTILVVVVVVVIG